MLEVLSINYIKQIISSLNKSINSTTPMTLRVLKNKTENLPKTHNLIKEFEQSQPLILQSHTKEHDKFIKTLDQGCKTKLVSNILNLKNLNSSIILSQALNDKLDILAHYLNNLKVTILSKDFIQAKRIIKKFTTQEDICLKNLIDDCKKFQNTIKSHRLQYFSLTSLVSSNFNELEDKAEITPNHVSLSKVHQLGLNQKQLLTLIGTEFSSISRSLLTDKDFRRFLKKK